MKHMQWLFWTGLMLATLVRADDAACVWEPMASTGSPAFAHHDMAYDSIHRQLVMVGTDMTAWPQDHWLIYFADSNLTWTAGGELSDGMGADPELAYDASRGVVVVYTGTNVVWEYDGDSWSRHVSATMPVCSLDGALMEYDPVRETVFLVGCDGYSGPAETWRWDGVDWTQVADTSHTPTGAVGGAMAFDAERGLMTLVTQMSMQTWTFDGTQWTRQFPVTSPTPPVWVFNMAYDENSGRIVLYGGEGSGYPTNTWAWDGTDWSMLDATGNPGGNIDFTFVYFPPQQALIMHGGWGEPDWQPRTNVWRCVLPSAPGADSDGDGMPDDYETTYFDGPTNGVATADDDTDGVSNYGEYIAGTNPRTNASVLAVTSFVENTNTATLVFQWPSVTGRVYTIMRATNAISAYTQHVGNLSANTPTNYFTNAAPADAGTLYYGIGVTWPDKP